MNSNTETATANFYDWERRGRGWEVWDFPVDLEPPFVPFWYHTAVAYQVQTQEKYVDDGRRETVLSFLATGFKNLLSPPKEEPVEEIDYTPLQAFPILNDDDPLYIFGITLPKGQKVRPDEAEQLLLMLSMSTYPISFEIVANHSRIILQFVCRETDASYVQSQLKAYFPNGIIQEREDDWSEIINDELSGTMFDFGLAEEFMRPLNSVASFELDPYTGLFGILENLGEDEQSFVQFIFKGAINPWSQSIIQSVTDSKGDSFFMDAPEMVPLAKEKIAAPLFGVVMRVVGQSAVEGRGRSIAKRVGDALVRMSTSKGNHLIALSNSDFTIQKFGQDLALRRSHRLGMLLNSKELATLIHLPSASVVSSKLQANTRKTKLAPKITEGHKYFLGHNEHHGEYQEVSLSSSQRLKHTHVIGATGTGKSTFLLGSIVQDIRNGEGVAVLDPHGDLIENILPWIPEERMNDVIIFDPADAEYPVGFNILSVHSEIEKDILSSDLVAVFRRLSTSWGDQMNSVFANAILAFLESDTGGTLIDLRRFLIEKPFRDTFLKTVTDPNIVYYWQKEFPLLRSNSIAPILTRLDTFLRPKLIRNMVAQKQGLNFEDILDSKKILLIKLSQGLIGTENSYLLGTFIVSKIQQTAMARQAKAKTDRSDFYLYIDEFQYFITPSMSSILSGARKYHLGLILAHQDMQQLMKQDSELASSVISNAGTRICFRVGDIDAKKFEDGFSYFDAKDLQNLGTGEAIARVDRPEFDFSLEIEALDEGEPEENLILQQEAVAISRENYGTPRAEVEKMLEGMLGNGVTHIDKEPLQSVPKTKPPEPVKESISAEPIPEAAETQDREEPVFIVEPVSEAKIVEKKEQSQHRYLQTLIKKMAESRGYKATIELTTPDGKGRVDVALERDGKKIAVEVCVTSPNDWEVHNIEKCLAAGYDKVVECSTNKKTLENIQKKIEQKLSENHRSKVLVIEPEALFSYLDSEVAKEASIETRVKGYRVKVQYESVSPDEANAKKDSIAKVVADSLKKMKK